MSTYEAIYRVDKYILADAFRPSPFWGSHRKRIDAASLPPHTDLEIVDAAHHGAPGGYWLQKLTLFGPDAPRVLYSKAVPVNNHGDFLKPGSPEPQRHIEIVI